METAVDMILRNGGTRARLGTDRPSTSLSPDGSSDTYGKIFGLSLGALLVVCLALNAASSSPHIGERSERNLGQPCAASISTSATTASRDSLHTRSCGTVHLEQCAANLGGEELGYK